MTEAVLTTIQAILPENRIERTLEDLEVGVPVYVTPWMMYIDSQRLCWLNPRATFSDRPGGTVQMRVMRRNDGFHVKLPKDVLWSRAVEGLDRTMKAIPVVAFDS